MSSIIDRWTHCIVRGEASLTDVPEHVRPRVARQVKVYANRFPDVGRSATVTRLVGELRQVEVLNDE